MLVGGFIIALFVGFLTGVFGVGGGFLLTPALMIILSVPATSAVATDLVTIFATSSLGLIRRYKSDTIDIRLGFTIASGSIPGVVIGKMILGQMDNMEPLNINGHEIVAVQFILLSLFVLLLFSVASYMLYDQYILRKYKTKTSRSAGVFASMKIPPYAAYKTLSAIRMPVIVLIVFGFFVGILTGMMGVGGGVIMLPALIYLVGQEAVKAAGTSLMLVWISSLIAVTLNGKEGVIIYDLLAVMLIGGLLGTFVGTKIGLKAQDSKMRIGFIGVVLVAMILIGIRIIQMIKGISVIGR
ncbi:MAG: sulfite exporter TauE/SafE family protein [Planctomycetes bacterium]|nr:sulfite exporter TauE/SafE family protein [Planctomycetota bacterium]